MIQRILGVFKTEQLKLAKRSKNKSELVMNITNTDQHQTMFLKASINGGWKGRRRRGKKAKERKKKERRRKKETFLEGEENPSHSNHVDWYIPRLPLFPSFPSSSPPLLPTSPLFSRTPSPNLFFFSSLSPSPLRKSPLPYRAFSSPLAGFILHPFLGFLSSTLF